MVISLVKIFFIVIHTIIFSILAIVLFPINFKGKVFHILAKPWAKGILMISGVKIKTKGIENIEKGKNYIFVSNHSSLFDIPIVTCGIPSDFRFIAKKELTKIPVFGQALKYGGYIIIDRARGVKAMRSLEEAIKKIRDGISVILFAEGTRSKDGSIQQFKRGSFLLACRTGIPIMPLTIKGSADILPKKKLKIQSGVVELIFDKPVIAGNVSGKQDEMNLMEKVRNIIINNYIN